MSKDYEDFYCDEVLTGNTEIDKVLETENVLAFFHTRPFYEVHIVVIPKKHITSLIDIGEDEEHIMKELLSVMRTVSQQINQKHGACTVSTNIGDYQSNKHMHWHIHYGDRIRLIDGTWC